MKTLEKINRKAIRKSLEKGKPMSAQTGPLNSARAPLCPTGGPRLSAPISALTPLSLSLSLIAPWGRPVSAVSLVCACSLSVPPSPPVSSSSTSRPRSPHRGRAHVHAFSGHVHAPAPLLSPAPCSPTSPLSFAPSAQLSRPLSHSAHACRELRHHPPSTTACSMAAVTLVPRPVPR
jgi:hypothetical protein